MDFFGFVVFAMLVVGPAVGTSLDLPSPPDECKAEVVKSPNGDYYYERFLDPNGDCTYVSKRESQ